MAYVRRWERLSDVVTRVMEAAGISEDEAKTDICRAISDRAIKLRCKLASHASKPMHAQDTVLEGKHFDIPTALKPEGLDWEKSCPVKAWSVWRGSYDVPGYWYLEWIELFSDDVTKVLCPTPSEPGAMSTSQPALESRVAPVGSGLGSIAGPLPAGAGSARPRGPRPKNR
jgi:hypothetical protein